jgi:hypothetical protein
MAATDAHWMICSAAGHDHKTPDTQHGSGDCACCLAMCCTGATVPDADAGAVALPTRWTALSFTLELVQQLRPAPSAGGFARAPPASA